MTKQYLFISLIYLMAACTTDSADRAAGQDPEMHEAITSKNATPNPGDEIICRREPVIGSNFSRKICRTRREVEEEVKDSREVMDRIRRTTTTNAAGED